MDINMVIMDDFNIYNNIIMSYSIEIWITYELVEIKEYDKSLR